MKLTVDRRWKKATYTIGILYVDGVRFSETLEDRDRGLKQTDSYSSIRSRKVYGETAIPTGTYEIRMDVVSPKYGAVTWYKNLCGGKMPRLTGVPGFEGILIHPGNTALDSYGCLLVGRNTKVGQVTSSKDTFAALYKKMKAVVDRGEKITIEIR
jgi:hypothetical protein